MKNSERTIVFGFNRKVMEIIHCVMLIGMLHSSFIAPAQPIIWEFFNGNKAKHTHSSSTAFDSQDSVLSTNLRKSDSELQKSIIQHENVNLLKEKIEQKTYFQADIFDGFIGVSEDKPLDDAKDNLFKITLDEVPTHGKIYLQYELYGVEGLSSVSRSVNDMPSTGGYIVKKNTQWTLQQEELANTWLKEGVNTILFTAPSDKEFGYRVKNVSIQFKENAALNPAMVLNIDQNTLYVKENRLYIKGFVQNPTENLKVEVGGEKLLVYKNQFEGIIQLTQENIEQKKLLVKAIDSNGLLGQEYVYLSNLIEADLQLSFDERLSEHSKLFSAFAGNNLFTEGAGIIVPDSAVTEHKKISISALRKKDIAPMNSGMINVTKGGGAYRFLPDGTKFAKHVQIQVAYDHSLVPSGYTEKDIQTFYFSAESKRWVSIEKDTVDIASKMIVSNTNHFTDYINGIIQVPETPETSAFIPTMMSDIKAANPTSGMTLISPPEASQKGSAGVSYPLKVPSGRGGLQPSLAIQYNSDGGNGLLGLGWDMSTSALSIDTRWGVPILSDTHETEIYTLNGEQLMYPKIENVEQDSVDWMPNRHYDATTAEDVYSTVERERIDNAVFTMRRQGGFETLERLGTDPSTYYWKVTNTDGVVSWYGGKTGVEENYVLKNADGKVVHWSLFMVEDVHGNNMKYYYTKETVGSTTGINGNIEGGIFYYLNKITYTGYQDEDGGYSVEFIPTTTYRPDITIDSKLGIKLATTKLLNTIQVKHQNELIRRYNLNYDPGFSKFGKNRLLSIVEADAGNNEFYRHEFEYYDDIDDGNGNDVYFSAGVEVNLCPDEEVIEQPAFCYVAYDVKRIEVGQSAVVIYNNIAVQGGPFTNYSSLISALNSQFSGQFFYNSVVGYITVTGSTVIPQTISIIINGIGGVLNFTVCQFEASRSEGATQSYTFENTYPFGDPECPSFINTEFMVTGDEPMPSFNSYFSPLGSSATKGEGFGGYLGLIGVGCNWFAKNITFGFGIGVSGNRTKSEVSLIDINGDGLSDIVTQNGNQIRYRPHIVTRTFDQQGQEIIGHTFGLSRMITGIDRFYYSTGKSEQYNFSFNSVFSLGWEKSVSKSTTNIYFTDANGDGLIDIVKNGLVYFNHVESNGNLTFIPDSEASENLVIVAAPVSVTEPEEDPEFTLPSYDVVKVWEAPADGVITIDNDIILLDASQSAVVTVEKKNATIETQQCYSVDFVAPSVTSTLYKYSTNGSIYGVNNYTHTNSEIYGSCKRTSTRINSFKFNSSSTIYTPSIPSLLFLTHGSSQTGLTVNQCSGIIPQFCSPFDITNTDCADTSIQSFDSVNNIRNWFSSILDSNSVPYSSLSFENLSHNMLEINNFGTSHLYTFMNRYGYKFSFFSTSDQFDGKFKNGYNITGSIWSSNSFPDEELENTSQGPIIIGLNSQVHINGSLLGTFNLVDDFAAFQAAFQAVYGSAFQLTAPTEANNYSISIQMYGSTPFTNIMITPVANPSQSSTYPFTVTENCSVQRSSNMNLITPSYADIEPTKEAKELAINLWLADGKELTIPYEEVHPLLSFDFTANEKDDRITGVYRLEIKADQARWFDQDNNPIEGDLASKLLDLSGIDLLAYNRRFQEEHIQRTNQERKNRQINAQNWLTTYYDTKQSTLPERTNSSFLRSENQSECQETNALCLLYGTELNSTNVNVVNSLTTNCNGQPLAVEKGDRIYFRLHTNATGNPPVNWNPNITYVDSQFQGVVDQNGYDVYNTSYSDGFILTQSRAFTVPGKEGSASITWEPFTVDLPSDNIVFKVIKQAVDIDTQELVPGSETIYSQVCASNSNTNVIPTGLSSVTFTDDGTITQFLFVVESTSNVKWKDYAWNPVVTTTITENVIGENGTTTEGELTSTETNYPIVDYTVYKKYVCGPLYSTFDVSQVNGGANLTIRPMYGGVFSSGDYGKLHFVVKNNGKLVGSRSLVVNNGSLQSVSSLPAYDNPIVMDNLIGSQIEISFYAENDQENKGGELLVAKLQAAANSTVRISYSGSNYSVPNSSVNLHHRFNRFGPMYRQWGQFFYNPAQVTGATASTYGNLIKEDVLFYEYDLDELQNLIDAAEGLDLVVTEEDSGDNALAALADLQEDYEAFAQDGSAFLPPTALFEAAAEPKWIAFHSENYAGEQSFRAAPMTQSLSSEYDVEPYNYQGLLNTGAVGINKIFRSKGQNISAGGSYEGIGGSVSKSIQGSGKLVTDYTDLNGDRYPDVVTTDKIQFTTRTGGLKTEINRENEEQIVTLNSNNNFGLGVSGGFGGNNDAQGAKGSTAQKVTTTTNSTKSSTSIGLSGNFSTGKSFTDSFWSDVNGDGLSDLITKNVTSIQVFLNKGGKLESSSAVWTNLGNVFESRATNIGGGVGLSLWNSSIQGGVSLTSSWNNTKNTFLDINGDGLVDFVDSDDELNVAINRGNRYIAQQQWSDYNLKKESVSVTAGGNLAFTIAPNFGIPFTSLCIKFFALTVNGNVSTSTNKTEKTITDFDGDGYPDLIEKISGTQVRVHHSKIRRTDKLKTVTNSLGGKFTLDYQVHKITYDNPHPKWVLSTVEIDDKYNLVNDGQDIYKKNFTYENPRYDRRERDFYGFETVTSIDYTVDEEGEQDEVYRTSVTKYHNRSYFLKGLVKETALYKGTIDNNLLFSRSENEYEIRRLLDDNLVVDTLTGGVLPHTFDVGGTEGRRSAIVFLTKQKSYVYELGSSPLVNESVLKYDEKGRVIVYDYLGNPSDTADNYKTTIAYHDIPLLTDKNIIKIPSEVIVTVNNQVKRKRQTDNINPNTGVIERIKQFYSTSSFAQVDLKYDEYGNIVHIFYPENETGQRMEYIYVYDTEHHKYIINTTDAFGYSSESNYNSKFDVPELVKDLAGNETWYKYDSNGRLVLVLGPKEIANQSPYTIAFSYFPKYTDLQSSPYQGLVTEEEFVPVALTNHIDEQHNNNTIDTYTFVDGMSRVMQVKKDITINRNENPTQSPVYIEMMSVSGAVTYDEFGRAIQQYHPSFEGKSNSINFKYNQDAIVHFKQSIYDELDRVVESIDEEGNQSFAEYSIDGAFHKTRSVTQQSSTVDIISESFKDVNGRVIKTNNVGPNGDIFTHFAYNAIGELLNYTDDMGMITSYKYDLLGRKVYMNHPDRGDLFYRYDDASNLTYLQTTNLATDNAFIHYGYQYNRLESIKYPEVVSGFENLSNVNYTFGAPSSGNETGRLICQEDASGRQEFKYGNMGEVISNKRTIIAPTPNLPNRTYVTEFNYDSWNRLQGMVYPDGEKVFYFYDLGGNLNGVEGDHRYVERVDYDHYEQRRYIKYGNGTETIYDYSPELRRLEQLQVLTSNSEHLLKNSYAYDFVGNVTKIENSATYHSVNHMGGKYEHNYGYDNLNRLIGAKGGFSGHASQQELGNDFESEYKLKMDYNSTHGIVNKSQDHSKNAIQFLPNTYTNDYTYFEGTHKLKQIDNPNNGDFESFNYDQNGNIISRVNQNNNQKYYFWDESDRLRVAVERLRLHHYIYDAGGQRVLKASSSMEDLYENGQLVNSTVQMGNYTSYPSAFLVVDPDGVYSKHYYAGAQRIAARVGVESADVLFPEDQANFCSQEGGRTAEEHKKLQQNDLQHYLDKGEIKTKLSFKEYQPKVEKEEEETTASSDKGESYAARPKDQIYYYHPDHLGTATFLTDGNGLPYEFFLNLPFGETMAEQHSQTADYDNRWKFTGHELDRETGLYYAGARYFDPKISIWLSVDPLAEKYPNWNPYNYVMQNPINLIDPTGMCPEEGDPQKKQNVNVVVLPKNIPKTDVAINNIKYSAENDLDENVLVLYVTGIKDLGKQLKENNVESIGTLSNHAHGNYNENSLKVGDDNLNTTNDFKKLGETLKPFCTENTNIILQSCHAGSGKDLTKSEANMKALGDASGANVYAPMTWGRGSISLFNNGKGAVSTIPHKYRDVWWKEGHPLNRINSTFMDQYKRYNPNPRCWEDKFSTIKGGRFQTNGTLKF